MDKTNLDKLKKEVSDLYQTHSKKLLFHGWHHITFVRKKAIKFAQSINANIFLVESSALVHDLNYILKPNSEPEEAEEYRREILERCDYSKNEIKRIETIILESHTGTRGAKISSEGKALSDADTLFKALPITPIIFANKYIIQNKVDIRKLAYKVTSEQNKLLEEDLYFYTDLAKKKYLHWAKANLALWSNVVDALDDPDVAEVLTIAENLKVL